MLADLALHLLSYRERGERMRTFGLLCAALWLISCASNGDVIQTSGTHSLPDAEIARMEIPSALTLLTADGEKIVSVQAHDTYQVRLLPGPRRLRFAYEENWGNPSTYDWVYSDHIVEIVFTAQAGVMYLADYPRPENRNAARRLADDLSVWVDSPDGTRVESQQVGPHGSPLTRLVSGGESAASVAAPATAAVGSSTGSSVDQAEALLAEQDALQRLMLWWKLATDEERSQFQEWVEAQ